jgi:hypothetical protein
MAAQSVIFQDCRASGVHLKRNLIQTSLGRRQRGFYVLFCVLNVPWFRRIDLFLVEIVLLTEESDSEKMFVGFMYRTVVTKSIVFFSH